MSQFLTATASFTSKFNPPTFRPARPSFHRHPDVPNKTFRSQPMVGQPIPCRPRISPPSIRGRSRFFPPTPSRRRAALGTNSATLPGPDRGHRPSGMPTEAVEPITSANLHPTRQPRRDLIIGTSSGVRPGSCLSRAHPARASSPPSNNDVDLICSCVPMVAVSWR